MGNLTMNIKQRLTQMIDIQNENPPIDTPIVELCRDALAEIERCEATALAAFTALCAQLEPERWSPGKHNAGSPAELENQMARLLGRHWVTLALWDGRETYGPAMLVRFEKIVAIETVHDEKTPGLQRSKLHLQGGGTLLVLESPADICGMAL